MTDPLLDRLAAEGFALDVREPVVDVEATLRKLKRAKVEVRGLPSGLLGQGRKLREICEARGITPVWGD